MNTPLMVARLLFSLSLVAGTGCCGGALPAATPSEATHADAAEARPALAPPAPVQGSAAPTSTSAPVVSATTNASTEPHDHAHGTASPQPATQAVVYTCPMHAEVQSDKPGSCPKCGMTLQKK